MKNILGVTIVTLILVGALGVALMMEALLPTNQISEYFAPVQLFTYGVTLVVASIGSVVLAAKLNRFISHA